MNGLTLMLNAAEQRLQFGLARDGIVLCGQDWFAASRGAELLAPALADAVLRLGAVPADIARIACVHGPGGFTGLRLVLSTASALHHALGIPLAPVNYLHLLAEGSAVAPGHRVRVLTNARRELVYCQDFCCREEGVFAPCGDVKLLWLEALMHDLSTAEDIPDVWLGSGALRHRQAIHAAVPGVRVLPDEYAQPQWEVFLRVAERAEYVQADLSPLYCRASEAEDNLELLAKRRGDNPAEARATLEFFLQREPHSQL